MILTHFKNLLLKRPSLKARNEPTFCADGDELDTLACDEVESLVDVGNLVEPHLAAICIKHKWIEKARILKRLFS
jgi:hypothetical protein